MKIVITQFVTLDGVSQGPGSAEEDTTGGFQRGGWFVPYLDETFVQQASDWLDLADGLLFGRRTYEAFARDWPQIPEPDPFTVRMNTLPKYVVTNTLDRRHVEPDHRAPRRSREDGRRAQGATGPGTANPWQQPSGFLFAGSRTGRHPAAGRRSHHHWRGQAAPPARRHQCRTPPHRASRSPHRVCCCSNTRPPDRPHSPSTRASPQ